MIQLLGCEKSNLLKLREGLIEVNGGKIWYEVFGSGNKTPKVALHVGTRCPSYYYNPLKSLAKERPVILYDQLGCGRSDILTDTTLISLIQQL